MATERNHWHPYLLDFILRFLQGTAEAREHNYGPKIPQRKQTNCGIWNVLLQSIGNHCQCIIYDDERMKISTFLIGIDICEI